MMTEADFQNRVHQVNYFLSSVRYHNSKGNFKILYECSKMEWKMKSCIEKLKKI